MHKYILVILLLGFSTLANAQGYEAEMENLDDGTRITINTPYCAQHFVVTDSSGNARVDCVRQVGYTTWLTKLYCELLNREPDPAGLSHWNAILLDGQMTKYQVVAEFMASPEYAWSPHYYGITIYNCGDK